MTGQDFGTDTHLSEEKLNALHTDADVYRGVEYARYHSRSHAFAVWLGGLMLRWGRRLRERDGKVIVQIHTFPRVRAGKAA